MVRVNPDGEGVLSGASVMSGLRISVERDEDRAQQVGSSRWLVTTDGGRCPNNSLLRYADATDVENLCGWS